MLYRFSEIIRQISPFSKQQITSHHQLSRGFYGWIRQWKALRQQDHDFVLPEVGYSELATTQSITTRVHFHVAVVARGRSGSLDSSPQRAGSCVARLPSQRE